MRSLPQQNTHIAIALSAHNCSQYLANLCDSLIAQSNPNWQCYIRNNGSTDHTEAVIQHYCETDSRFVSLSDNKGSLSYNDSYRCILAQMTAPYIAIANQCDIWHQNRLAVCLATMMTIENKEQQQAALVHSDAELVSEQLDSINNRYIGKRGLASGLNGILFANSVIGGTIMMNHSLSQQAATMPTTMHSDYHWAILCELAGVRKYIPQSLIQFRKPTSPHGSHMPSSTDNADKIQLKDNAILSESLLSSFSAYPNIKHDYRDIKRSRLSEIALREYAYLFEGSSRTKKLWIAIKNHYPFYRKKDFIGFLRLLLSNKNLMDYIPTKTNH